jgi:hypothetical protein
MYITYSTYLINWIKFYQSTKSSPVSSKFKASYTRSPSKDVASGNSTKTFVNRDLVHLWISIRDIRHGLIHIDRVLKKPGILSKLTHIESWVTSYDENKSESKMNDDVSLKFIKARARTLVWDIMEMKNEVLYPHPGLFEWRGFIKKLWFFSLIHFVQFMDIFRIFGIIQIVQQKFCTTW